MSKIFYNFWYKIASFLIALLIWTLVQGSENVEKTVSIKVPITVPESFIVKDGPEKYVTATIVGPSAIVDKTSNSNLEAKINLSDVEIGSTDVEIDPSDISNLDTRLKVVIKNPTISIFIDKKINKVVPIREKIQGQPALGYSLESVKIEPSILTVVGAQSEVDKIKFVYTEPIDLSGFQGTVSKKINIMKSNSDSVIYSIKRVETTLSIVKNMSTKIYQNVPININAPLQYLPFVKIIPSSVDVEIKGNLKSVENLDVSSIVKITANPDFSKKEEYEDNLEVKSLIDDIEVFSFNPSKVQIIINDRFKSIKSNK